ncbi:hypothetical protein CSV63_09095 [Sporosarcina sp. P34]|uniref:hypothetical protein n=1 Tax=Sporosarcina sp. P34 TaxID=2048247 RepID=UPI000C167011|nr:hypothetical protein [Sporosarcina sp. P34]PID15309.1 hypothetical protein CSV63_09095 [Sporosarcina sp. P34]
MTKQRTYFLGFFVLFPIFFMIISFLWKYVFRGIELGEVLTDTLGILAIYYFIVSVFFSFRMRLQ